MKTTIELSDELIRQVRRVAQQEGASLRALVEEGLQRSLEARRQAVRRPLDFPVYGGSGPDARVPGRALESHPGRNLSGAWCVIAVDTNLLVYAHRPEMSFHERAREVLTEAVGGTEPVSVPWPCVHEFLATVSNPRIFGDPTPIGVALDAARRLLASLSGGFLAEGEGYLDTLERIARPAPLAGSDRARCQNRRPVPLSRSACALVCRPRFFPFSGLDGHQSVATGLTCST